MSRFYLNRTVISDTTLSYIIFDLATGENVGITYYDLNTAVDALEIIRFKHNEPLEDVWLLDHLNAIKDTL